MNLDPFSLPSVRFGEFQNLPAVKAVYFVLRGTDILYIGKSVNIKNRWVSHEKRELLQTEKAERIAWVEGFGAVEEREFITTFHPAHNRRSNPHYQGEITHKENVSSAFSKWITQQFINWQSTHGRRYTLSAFAEYLEVSPATVSQWLSGNRTPRDIDTHHFLAWKLDYGIFEVFNYQPSLLMMITASWPDLSDETQNKIFEVVRKATQE